MLFRRPAMLHDPAPTVGRDPALRAWTTYAGDAAYPSQRRSRQLRKMASSNRVLDTSRMVVRSGSASTDKPAL